MKGKVKIKVAEYNIEKDSVEFLVSRGVDNFGRIIFIPTLEKLIESAEKGTSMAGNISETDQALLSAIIENGGLDWVMAQIDDLIEL